MFPLVMNELCDPGLTSPKTYESNSRSFLESLENGDGVSDDWNDCVILTE